MPEINRGQVAQTLCLPSPIGGLNTKDSLAEMPVTDAPLMVNWWPMPTMIEMRQGSALLANLSGAGQVNSLFPYNGAGSSQALIAASGTSIYVLPSPGFTPTQYSGYTSDKWSAAQISTPGGQFLAMVNGSDPYMTWNGSAWTVQTVTGVTTSNLNFVALIQQRLWFVQKNSLVAWYLPIQSIAGAASYLDLGAIVRKGGNLVAISNWTVSGGFGEQALTAFITDQGELVIYEGYDPTQASTWSLVGIYEFGAPLSNQCFLKQGTDLLLLTKEGVLSMQRGQFFVDASAQKSAVTDKIQSTITGAAQLYRGNYGWTMAAYPIANALIVNVPVNVGSQQQYAMNTLTGAWTNFQGWAANCFAVLNDQLFFGTNGAVYQAWIGNSDNGAAIYADCIQAYSDLGLPGRFKQLISARPIVTQAGNVSYSIGSSLDFSLDSAYGMSTPQSLASQDLVWDTGKWDQNYWGGDIGTLVSAQQYFGGIARNVGIRLKANGSYAFAWAATDVSFVPGSYM